MAFKRKLLVVILIVFLLINLYVTNLRILADIRITRVITTCVFFIFYIYCNGIKKIWLFYALLGFLISDFALIYYEKPIYNKANSILSIISYWFIIKHYFKNTILKIGKKNALFYSILAVVCCFCLFLILNSIHHKLHDVFNTFLLFIYGITLITVCVLAASYNSKFGIMRSTYFVFFVFAFSLSDFCAVLAYYFDFYALFFLNRTIYIFALFFVINYVLTKPEIKENYLVE